MKPIVWEGCYEERWNGVIVPAAFAHPAKFAKGLIERILRHGLQVGWWSRGDLIGDPFGGIASGGIMAAYAGLRWVGVELEQKFVDLGIENLSLHRRRWEQLNDPRPLLVQGDSRRFAEIIGSVAGVITSPPYAETLSLNATNGIDFTKAKEGGKKKTEARAACGMRYGQTDGQIGALPAGTVAGVVTSPPYNPNDKSDSKTARRDPRADRMTGSFRTSAAYGDTPGQIGRMAEIGGIDAVVTSPPYAESLTPGSGEHMDTLPDGIDPKKISRADREGHRYSFDAGNIGNLKAGAVDSVVTSPPYGESNQDYKAGWSYIDPEKSVHTRRGQQHEDGRYGESDGQLGNVTDETYWQAMAQVYGQCRLAIRPGGYMAVVVKDYVKAKKIVPLCDQTLELLTRLGFTPVARIHAMLVKHKREAALHGGEIVTTKERKSFFRRLAEKKGSPRIDWEEVIVVQNQLPTAGRSGAGNSIHDAEDHP